jgi:hypothetical protein
MNALLQQFTIAHVLHLEHPRAATPSLYLSDLIVCSQIAFKTLVESLGVLLNPLARSTWVTPNRGA